MYSLELIHNYFIYLYIFTQPYPLFQIQFKEYLMKHF